ncbi:MAG: hypothetical protein IJX11_02585 [Bacteroidales bacterium]|nr:hypothetical protein [Bacteroidales bacterium]
MEKKNVVVATRNANRNSKTAEIVAVPEIDIEKELDDIYARPTHGGENVYEYSEELSLNENMGAEPAGSFDFTLDCDKPNVKQAYDNTGAFETLLSIMNRNGNINVEFRLDKENFHYAWIETRGVAGFKYYLKNESFNGIVRYLTKGEVTDFDPAPEDYEVAKFTSDFYIMKLFVDKGMMLQCTPLFRERPGYVSAFLPCKKGKITFRVKRTEQIVNYLREAGQFI